MERLPSIIALECLGAPIAGETTTTLRDDETKIESSLLAAPRERERNGEGGGGEKEREKRIK